MDTRVDVETLRYMDLIRERFVSRGVVNMLLVSSFMCLSCVICLNAVDRDYVDGGVMDVRIIQCSSHRLLVGAAPKTNITVGITTDSIMGISGTSVYLHVNKYTHRHESFSSDYKHEGTQINGVPSGWQFSLPLCSSVRLVRVSLSAMAVSGALLKIMASSDTPCIMIVSGSVATVSSVGRAVFNNVVLHWAPPGLYSVAVGFREAGSIQSSEFELDVRSPVASIQWSYAQSTDPGASEHVGPQHDQSRHGYTEDGDNIGSSAVRIPADVLSVWPEFAATPTPIHSLKSLNVTVAEAYATDSAWTHPVGVLLVPLSTISWIRAGHMAGGRGGLNARQSRGAHARTVYAGSTPGYGRASAATGRQGGARLFPMWSISTECRTGGGSCTAWVGHQTGGSPAHLNSDVLDSLLMSTDEVFVPCVYAAGVLAPLTSFVWEIRPRLQTKDVLDTHTWLPQGQTRALVVTIAKGAPNSDVAASLHETHPASPDGHQPHHVDKTLGQGNGHMRVLWEGNHSALFSQWRSRVYITSPAEIPVLSVRCELESDSGVDVPVAGAVVHLFDSTGNHAVEPSWVRSSELGSLVLPYLRFIPLFNWTVDRWTPLDCTSGCFQERTMRLSVVHATGCRMVQSRADRWTENPASNAGWTTARNKGTGIAVAVTTHDNAEIQSDSPGRQPSAPRPGLFTATAAFSSALSMGTRPWPGPGMQGADVSHLRTGGQATVLADPLSGLFVKHLLSGMGVIPRRWLQGHTLSDCNAWRMVSRGLGRIVARVRTDTHEHAPRYNAVDRSTHDAGTSAADTANDPVTRPVQPPTTPEVKVSSDRVCIPTDAVGAWVTPGRPIPCGSGSAATENGASGSSSRRGHGHGSPDVFSVDHKPDTWLAARAVVDDFTRQPLVGEVHACLEVYSTLRETLSNINPDRGSTASSGPVYTGWGHSLRVVPDPGVVLTDNGGSLAPVGSICCSTENGIAYVEWNATRLLHDARAPQATEDGHPAVSAAGTAGWLRRFVWVRWTVVSSVSAYSEDEGPTSQAQHHWHKRQLVSMDAGACRSDWECLVVPATPVSYGRAFSLYDGLALSTTDEFCRDIASVHSPVGFEYAMAPLLARSLKSVMTFAYSPWVSHLRGPGGSTESPVDPGDNWGKGQGLGFPSSANGNSSDGHPGVIRSMLEKLIALSHGLAPACRPVESASAGDSTFDINMDTNIIRSAWLGTSWVSQAARPCINGWDDHKDEPCHSTHSDESTAPVVTDHSFVVVARGWSQTEDGTSIHQSIPPVSAETTHASVQSWVERYLPAVGGTHTGAAPASPHGHEWTSVTNSNASTTDGAGSKSTTDDREDLDDSWVGTDQQAGSDVVDDPWSRRTRPSLQTVLALTDAHDISAPYFCPAKPRLTAPTTVVIGYRIESLASVSLWSGSIANVPFSHRNHAPSGHPGLFVPRAAVDGDVLRLCWVPRESADANAGNTPARRGVPLVLNGACTDVRPSKVAFVSASWPTLGVVWGPVGKVVVLDLVAASGLTVAAAQWCSGTQISVRVHESIRVMLLPLLASSDPASPTWYRPGKQATQLGQWWSAALLRDTRYTVPSGHNTGTAMTEETLALALRGAMTGARLVARTTTSKSWFAHSRVAKKLGIDIDLSVVCADYTTTAMPVDWDARERQQDEFTHMKPPDVQRSTRAFENTNYDGAASFQWGRRSSREFVDPEDMAWWLGDIQIESDTHPSEWYTRSDLPVSVDVWPCSSDTWCNSRLAQLDRANLVTRTSVYLAVALLVIDPSGPTLHGPKDAVVSARIPNRRSGTQTSIGFAVLGQSACTQPWNWDGQTADHTLESIPKTTSAKDTESACPLVDRCTAADFYPGRPGQPTSRSTCGVPVESENGTEVPGWFGSGYAAWMHPETTGVDANRCPLPVKRDKWATISASTWHVAQHMRVRVHADPGSTLELSISAYSAPTHLFPSGSSMLHNLQTACGMPDQVSPASSLDAWAWWSDERDKMTALLTHPLTTLGAEAFMSNADTVCPRLRVVRECSRLCAISEDGLFPNLARGARVVDNTLMRVRAGRRDGVAHELLVVPGDTPCGVYSFTISAESSTDSDMTVRSNHRESILDKLVCVWGSMDRLESFAVTTDQARTGCDGVCTADTHPQVPMYVQTTVGWKINQPLLTPRLRIVDANGAGVRGIVVWLELCSSSGDCAQLQSQTTPDPCVHQGTTDAHGVVRLDKFCIHRTVPSGSYVVGVRVLDGHTFITSTTIQVDNIHEGGLYTIMQVYGYVVAVMTTIFFLMIGVSEYASHHEWARNAFVVLVWSAAFATANRSYVYMHVGVMTTERDWLGVGLFVTLVCTLIGACTWYTVVVVCTGALFRPSSYCAAQDSVLQAIAFQYVAKGLSGIADNGYNESESFGMVMARMYDTIGSAVYNTVRPVYMRTRSFVLWCAWRIHVCWSRYYTVRSYRKTRRRFWRMRDPGVDDKDEFHSIRMHRVDSVSSFSDDDCWWDDGADAALSEEGNSGWSSESVSSTSAGDTSPPSSFGGSRVRDKSIACTTPGHQPIANADNTDSRYINFPLSGSTPACVDRTANREHSGGTDTGMNQTHLERATAGGTSGGMSASSDAKSARDCLLYNGDQRAPTPGRRTPQRVLGVTYLGSLFICLVLFFFVSIVWRFERGVYHYVYTSVTVAGYASRAADETADQLFSNVEGTVGTMPWSADSTANPATGSTSAHNSEQLLDHMQKSFAMLSNQSHWSNAKDSDRDAHDQVQQEDASTRALVYDMASKLKQPREAGVSWFAAVVEQQIGWWTDDVFREFISRVCRCMYAGGVVAVLVCGYRWFVVCESCLDDIQNLERGKPLPVIEGACVYQNQIWPFNPTFAGRFVGVAIYTYVNLFVSCTVVVSVAAAILTTPGIVYVAANHGNLILSIVSISMCVSICGIIARITSYDAVRGIHRTYTLNIAVDCLYQVHSVAGGVLTGFINLVVLAVQNIICQGDLYLYQGPLDGVFNAYCGVVVHHHMFNSPMNRLLSLYLEFVSGNHRDVDSVSTEVVADGSPVVHDREESTSRWCLAQALAGTVTSPGVCVHGVQSHTQSNQKAADSPVRDPCSVPEVVDSTFRLLVRCEAVVNPTAAHVGQISEWALAIFAMVQDVPWARELVVPPIAPDEHTLFGQLPLAETCERASTGVARIRHDLNTIQRDLVNHQGVTGWDVGTFWTYLVGALIDRTSKRLCHAARARSAVEIVPCSDTQRRRAAESILQGTCSSMQMLAAKLNQTWSTLIDAEVHSMWTDHAVVTSLVRSSVEEIETTTSADTPVACSPVGKLLYGTASQRSSAVKMLLRIK